MYIYIYIYTERERERHIYIYIYSYIGDSFHMMPAWEPRGDHFSNATCLKCVFFISVELCGKLH